MEFTNVTPVLWTKHNVFIVFRSSRVTPFFNQVTPSLWNTVFVTMVVCSSVYRTQCQLHSWVQDLGTALSEWFNGCYLSSYREWTWESVWRSTTWPSGLTSRSHPSNRSTSLSLTWVMMDCHVPSIHVYHTHTHTHVSSACKLHVICWSMDCLFLSPSVLSPCNIYWCFFSNLATLNSPRHPLSPQAAEHLQSFIADCDRRTELAKTRLAETQDEISAEVAAKVTDPCCLSYLDSFPHAH